MSMYRTDNEYAKQLDASDPLASYREQFHIPKTRQGTDCLYFCGNSLGLQPKALKAAMDQELHDWQNLGVEGHFHAKNPWMPYHEYLSESLARLVGAKPIEVVAMNTLSVNLHLMMVSFYRPSKQRYKIVIEAHAFPSDQYAVQSQIRYHGFDPEQALVELQPRPGEHSLRTDDIEAYIEREGDSIALIMLGGVNYYTGQLFDMQRITQAGHKQGCIVSFDLAHAAGNVPLQLHQWGVDFACWCSYKYLNAGPGSVAGCFVHERHAQNAEIPRFCGWWGHDKQTRFKMGPDFQAIPGAEGWQLSNPPILSLVAVKTAMQIFDQVGMPALREKSVRLTGYMAFLLDQLNTEDIHILTPDDPEQRGCQLSIVVKENGRQIFESLTDAGVVCDWREPDCIRVAPVPLYNRYQDVHRFVTLLAQLIGLPNRLQEAN